MDYDQKLGIYIHYPFCEKICPYCDFNVYQSSLSVYSPEHLLLKSYERDLLYFKETVKIDKIESIYFGGGTPSLMSPDLVEKIITIVQKNFKFDNLEITLEANPTNFEIKKFRDFSLSGVNRLSLGVQSFNDKELSFLGRSHDKESAIKAIENVEKIFKTYTFDLIYGLPDQTIEQLDKNLEIAIKLAKYHISCYSLTIEEGTPFGRFVKQGRMKEKTSDEMANFVDFTWNKLEDFGFKHYEVSNFSKDKNFAVHNSLYWKYHDYIGVGPGSHGRIVAKNGTRYSTIISNSLKKWIDGDFLQEQKIITNKDMIYEIIISNLRSVNGINFDDIRHRFNIDILNYLDLKHLKKLHEHSYIAFDNAGVKPLRNGMMILDSITQSLIQNLQKSL